MIYADHAATTKLDEDAFECMKEYLMDSYGNPSQLYSFSRKVKKAIKESRDIIANCIGADSAEIFFTSGGTESDNWALKGVMKKANRRELIVSSIEHHAILNAADALFREGYEVKKLDVTREGVVMPSFLESMLNNNTALVSVMFSNNEIGSIQPIKELAMLTHEKGTVFHTDAVQAVGHIPINVKELDIDMMSASAHKFNGPRGIGFLYIKKGTEIESFMDGGSQEKNMRAGTENVPAIVGMATALQKNCNSIEKDSQRLLVLEEELISRLREKDIDFIRNGSTDHLPGNVNLSFRNSDGEMLLHRLDLMGIYVSTGSACDSTNTQISHVIKAIKVPENYAEGTIRISLGKDNSIEDVKKIVDALCKVLII